MNERTRKWRNANPERQKALQLESYHRNKNNPAQLASREAMRLRVYGLTREDLDTMIKRQNGLCAICKRQHTGRGSRLHIDHDHVTGKIRELLCGRCNPLLGMADDSPARLRAAADYLDRHKE